MTIALAVKKPANITATNMVLGTFDCDEPCNTDVTVTWQNTGGRAKSFEPANVNLGPSQTTSYLFALSGLTLVFNKSLMLNRRGQVSVPVPSSFIPSVITSSEHVQSIASAVPV